MSKEEPAWKAELSADIECAIGLNQDCGGAEGVYALRDHVFAAMEAHILAAEQRGFQAGVNKTGDSVGKLREQLKTAEQRGRQQALSAVKAEIEVFRDNIPSLRARESWKLGYEGGLVALSVLLDSIMPDTP